jgi:hypothetical protein
MVVAKSGVNVRYKEDSRQSGVGRQHLLTTGSFQVSQPR